MDREHKREEEMEEKHDHESYQEVISSLPLNEGRLKPFRNYRGWWYPQQHLSGALSFADHFTPRETDIFLASPPKSGTTWLKALAYATLNRNRCPPSAPDHPLLRKNPHELVRLVDEIYQDGPNPEVDSLAPPRLLQCHMALPLLPESVTAGPGCRIVYICRDPKDTLVSTWHFVLQVAPPGLSRDDLPFAEFYENFCRGVSMFGPIWEHQLGYWRESARRPEKVLFLKYEDLKEDILGNLRRLAEFMGCPFSEEEEKEGVVEEIARLCSLDKLSGAEVNRSGKRYSIRNVPVKNSAYFRKGGVGDWKNHFTPEMAERLDRITEEKLRGSGLSFAKN